MAAAKVETINTVPNAELVVIRNITAIFLEFSFSSQRLVENPRVRAVSSWAVCLFLHNQFKRGSGDKPWHGRQEQTSRLGHAGIPRG